MRTGSSWLCSILGQHSQIQCEHELLHRTSYSGSASQAKTYLDRALFETAIRPVRGFKMLYHQFRGPNSADCYVFAYLFNAVYRCKIIHLQRRDPLATFVSRQLAARVGVWNVFTNKADFSNGRRTIEPGQMTPYLDDYNRPLTVDLNHLRRWCRNMRLWRAKVAELFPNHLEIFYEDLPDVAKVYDYLGVGHETHQGETVKMLKTPLEAIVTNYDEARTIAILECAATLAGNPDRLSNRPESPL